MFLYNATKSQVHNDWRGWHCAVDECRLFDKWVQRWNSRFHRETFHCFKHRFHFSYLYVISLPLSAAQWRPTTAQAWVAHRQAVPHIFCTASLWPHSSLHQTGSPSSACRLQISLQDHKSTFLLSLPICQSRAVFHRRLTPLLLWPLLSYMMCQTMGTLQQMHLVLKWKKCQWEINLRRRCTSSVNPQSTRNTVVSYASHAYQRCGRKQFCGFDSLGEMHSAGIKLLCTPDQTYCVVHNKDQWSRVI